MPEDELVEPNWRKVAWRRVGGMHVPVLAKIPRQHWREVLITCDANARFYAVYDHRLTIDQRNAAKALVAELPPPPSEAIRAKPTQVARMLVNAGVRRLLAEYDVTMDRVPSQS